MKDVMRISADELLRFSREVLGRVGMPTEHAEIVADHLVTASLRGVDSHGIMRLSIYVDGILKKQINPKPNIKVVNEGRTYALLDGDNSLGHIVAYNATKLAIDKAKKENVGIIGTRNHKHVGMLSYYLLKVIENEMIGIAMANTSPRISLPGFTHGILGTNPIAIGFPTKKFPIIFDAAMSVVSIGKIALAAKKGEPIPEGWAINKEGKITTDPKEALEGFVLPAGGHKGFGIALAVDILCGIVTGGNYGLKIPRSLFSQGGFVIMTFKIDSFRSYAEYLDEMDEYMHRLKSIKSIDGKELILPGEIESKTYAERLKMGIPVSEEIYNDLLRLAKQFNVCPPSPYFSKSR